MKLNDLTDAELGAIVREGPLWPILLEMENKKDKESPTVQAGQHEHQIARGTQHGIPLAKI